MSVFKRLLDFLVGGSRRDVPGRVSRELFDLIGTAQGMLQQRQLRSARATYERCLREYPESGPLVSFDLGCLYFMWAGDGEVARRFFQQAIEERRRYEGRWPKKNLDELEANACENLMLLSLSYGEYESWARRLEELQPREAILHGQRPRVHDMRERGLPWWSVLSWMTDQCYDFTNPSRDPRQHAKAAATLQLLLLHRRRLRLPLHDYWVNSGLYGSLLGWACSAYGMAIERTAGEVDPGEVRFMLEPALPLIEEARCTFPSDPNLPKLVDLARNILSLPVPGRAATKP